jgi:hypothetical protein
LRAAILDDEQARNQPMRRISDRHGARFGSRLHPRRDVRHVAEDLRLVARALTDHDQARIDADPCGQLRVTGLLVELHYRVEEREARACGALGIVVVRGGPTEVSHHAVAEIFRDVAVEARDRFGGCTMESGERLAPLLGVEPRGDPGRANQIAKEHRQMPPLAA